MDPLLKSLKDPKILKQVRTRQSFFKVRFKCAMSIANMPCLDQFKDPRLESYLSCTSNDQGKIRARSLMYDKTLN